jgi:hypothetical protein
MIVALAALAAFASSAAARTFTVNRADDPNPPGPCSANDCSLRAAVFAADNHTGADRIRFAKSLPPTIQVTASLPIRFKLTIEGPGSKKLAVSANQASRVFHMLSGRITIEGLTIRDGHETATPTGPQCPGSTAPAFTLGGGILQDAGSLKLDHVKLSNNEVVQPGAGGIVGGGGIAMIAGSLSIVHSQLTKNSSLGAAISSGGSVFSCAGGVAIKSSNIHDSTVTSSAIGEGGGIAVQTQSGDESLSLAMKKSTVSNNEVSSEAISDAGGVSVVNGPAEIDSSTISDNRGTVTGGGSIVDGAGLFIANTKATVTNSTIADNIGTAPLVTGGGILVAGNGQKLDLRSSTVAGNIADASNSGSGGNLAGAASAKLRNTIVAKGKATTGPNCDAAVKSSSHDLEDKDTCGFDGKGDRVNKNPKIGNLLNNGGPTDTLALKRTSPAIDHASKKTSPKRDQRGFKRDGKPDIGAYEFGAKP